MVLAVGIALTLNALLMAWGLAVGQQLFVNELAGTTFGPASTVFSDRMLVPGERLAHVPVAGRRAHRRRLVRGGEPARATGLRRATARTLESFGSGLGGTALAPLGHWVAARPRLAALGGRRPGLGGAAVGRTVRPRSGCWSVVLVVVLLVVLQILSGARSAGPDDDAGAVEQARRRLPRDPRRSRPSSSTSARPSSTRRRCGAGRPARLGRPR